MGLTLALVGCGAMGSALLKGWLTLSDSETRFEAFWVVAPHREKVEPFMENSRVQWFSSPQQLAHSPDVIVFALKPSLLENILPLYQSFNSLIISVASGKPLSFYEKIFPPSHPIVRAMPNTPVRIHKGAIGLLANAFVSSEQKSVANTCFQPLGFNAWLTSDEEIDKITAISGSGPAYVFFMIESLAQAAESLGLDKKTAINLALYTFWGASAYAHDSNDFPDVLRQHVTSPKGTTAAAINVLETGGLHHLMEAAVKAAYTRAKELGE